jgi:hypothetical protein
MGTHVDTTQRKNNQQKSSKPYAKCIDDYEMTIDNNKEDLKRKSYHYRKLPNDGGALAMMCGRDEKP